MIQEHPLEDRILEIVADTPGCLLEELVLQCPGATWSQIFVEVDRLSRIGKVDLTKEGPGVYVVRRKQKEGAR